MTGVLRDFSYTHPDFGEVVADDRGIVENFIGPDGKPVYAHGETGTVTTTGQANFDQWYRDVEGVNQRFELTLPFWQNGDVCTVESHGFFPLDDMGFGNEYLSHNYLFTFELHTIFVYRGGETFLFRGDDDVWVFINGVLAADIGGVHPAQEFVVDLDAMAETLGLEIGSAYTLDFFFAERHCCESNFRIDTNIAFVDCYGNTVMDASNNMCADAPPACNLAGWEGSECDTCSTQTQSDLTACRDYLDCYIANDCGPATCGYPDDVCGVNTIGGGAAKDIADQTFYCLCPWG